MIRRIIFYLFVEPGIAWMAVVIAGCVWALYTEQPWL